MGRPDGASAGLHISTVPIGENPARVKMGMEVLGLAYTAAKAALVSAML